MEGFAQLQASVKEKKKNRGKSAVGSETVQTHDESNPSREAYLKAKEEKQKEYREGLLANMMATSVNTSENNPQESRLLQIPEDEKIVLIAESDDEKSGSCNLDNPSKGYVKLHARTYTGHDSESREIASQQNKYYKENINDRLDATKAVSPGLLCSAQVERYNGRPTDKSPTDYTSVVPIDLNDKDLSGILLDIDTPASGCDDGSSLGNTVDSLFLSNKIESGYIGEKIAYKCLKEKYLNSQTIKIDWLNQTEEQGHPYDIVIQHPSGRIQYCEVKSHISNALTPESSKSTQWFISQQEIFEARKRSEEYFCVLISATLDQSGDELRPVLKECKLHIVGYEQGLMKALHDKTLSLILQLNKVTS